MSTEGLKKRDIQRLVQKVHTGSTVSSKNLASAADDHSIELGFPAEKITLVTTGDLQADVTPKIGNAQANTAISTSPTASTTTTSNMFTSVDISWTSGSGIVIILAK